MAKIEKRISAEDSKKVIFTFLSLIPLFLEYVKYVLDRESTIETSYMVDVGSFEVDFNMSILRQFTFICFFTPYIVFSGIAVYFFNTIIIMVTMKIYLHFGRRGLSRRISSIGCFNKLYTVIGYLGILMNTLIIMKMEGMGFSGSSTPPEESGFETKNQSRIFEL